MENIIFIGETYKLISLDYDSLKSYNIKNWKKNRPADKFRVEEIYNFYLNNNIDLLPGIIYIWFYNNRYYIYDGLHRYEALKKLNNNKIKIILYINFSQDENSIINDFTNINKSVPIPSLYTEYIEDQSQIKKDVCEEISEQLCKNYPQFVSTSRKPHTYNFNRDQIIDFISTLCIDFKIKNISYIIYKILLSLNDKAKKLITENKLECPSKCKKYNFFLFYLKKHYIKEEIEKYINENF